MNNQLTNSDQVTINPSVYPKFDLFSQLTTYMDESDFHDLVKPYATSKSLYHGTYSVIQLGAFNPSVNVHSTSLGF